MLKFTEIAEGEKFLNVDLSLYEVSLYYSNTV